MPTPTLNTRLPVEDSVDSLKQALRERDEVVLEAPPGAGKTTMVPLALMQEPWLAENKILMLEPRRIATKAAAMRMASLINESPGQTIGYRMRLETKTSKLGKIEIITEGILTRMLQQDPALEGVGLVIFDEFHERNLDSDLALSLCLKGREVFREAGNPLKILIMSATLDSNSIAQLLNDAPIISSAGKAYTVEVIYGHARQPKENPVERMVATIKQALSDNPQSSLLAFLPGQGEIRRVCDVLADWIVEQKISGIHLRPLYGNLSIEEQQAAIAPLSGPESSDQKVVLATNIAETSLTIEGVDVVVDSGLVREARFNPATGMTGLHTVKISNASSSQRMGRAGRLRPGKCYRLWSAVQQQQLAAYSSPEILKADLAPLALQLLQWGVGDPTELRWLDPPPSGPWQQAIALLHSLGAIETKANSAVLTTHGERMSSLPTHPRLAHMLLCGAETGQGKCATHLASLLSDRDPFAHDNPDINHRLELLSGNSPCPAQNRGWLRRTLDLAQQLEAKLIKPNVTTALSREQLAGYLLACAYPDRIARRRYAGGYQLANGRSANLSKQHYLGNSRWLAIAEISSMDGAKGDRIRTAVPLDEELFSTLLSDAVHNHTIAAWDKKSRRFVAEEQQKIGALILQSNKLDRVPAATKTAALIQHIRQEGLQMLSWTEEIQQWCARLSLLREYDGTDWPDVSQSALLATLDDWLAPYLNKVTLLADFRKLPLKDILSASLNYQQQQRLQQLVPTKLKVPSGSSIAIDYSETPPVLAVKLQEMFGCEQTPSVVAGKVPLVIHLLSPAGRPLQITQDLAGFWRTSYHEVKREMKGRYPKHPWPDDPLVAVATRRTKRHG